MRPKPEYPLMEDERAAQLAKLEEVLGSLTEQEEHGKLRALADDIRDLRDRLLAETEQEP